MNNRARTLIAIAIAAVVLPAYAGAKPGNGNAHGHGKGKTAVFKGTYVADGVVTVAHGNSRVRRGGYVGQDVAFDLTNAKLVVADTNGDGAVDASDITAGDAVVVKARVPRDALAVQPIAARQLVDQTNPPEEEDEGEVDEETPPVE